MICNHCGVYTKEPVGSPCDLCPDGLIEDDEIKIYGFSIEKYSEISEVETLMTGDGKSEFFNIDFGNGIASIGIAYGKGKGVGITERVDVNICDQNDVRWQIKFEN